MNRGLDDVSPTDFPLISYYLESEEHRIIVDTGGSAPNEGDWHQPYRRSEAEEMDRALAAVGVSPDDIDMVLFTHLHWDHAQNNHFFTKARFIVQKKELEAFRSGEDKGYEPEERGTTEYETVDGDVQIAPGIEALLAPGHSRGSQAFVVEVAGGKAIITGDLVPCYDNWTSVPKTPSNTIEDLDAALQSYAKLEALGIDKIYPGHEPGVFEAC
jgi:glyoxylase-like metal-dependent hydrolase (beta-lactamase superfamily II)